MKILAVSNFAEFVGGGEHTFCELIESLKPPWQVIAVVPGPGAVENRLHNAGTAVVKIPLSAIRPWTIHRVAASLVRVMNTIKNLAPSLIYANGPRSALYFGVVGHFLKIPVVWHCRVADNDRLLDPILKKILRLIIANSHATAQRFLTYTGCLRRAGHRQDTTVRKILHIARVSPEKRQDLTIEAFDILGEHFPDLQLYFIGGARKTDSKWWKTLQKKVTRSPFRDRIHWVGAVNDATDWMQEGSVVVLPSNKEGFGRVVVEAMACGVPVIASRVGGIKEIIADEVNGLLFTVGDSEALAARLRRLLTDDSLRERIVRNGPRRAGDFDTNLYLAKMKCVFLRAALP